MSDVEILGYGGSGIVYREGNKVFKIVFKDDQLLLNEYLLAKKIHKSKDAEVEEVKKYFLEIYAWEMINSTKNLPKEVTDWMDKRHIPLPPMTYRLRMEHVQGKSFSRILYKLFEEDIIKIFNHLNIILKGQEKGIITKIPEITLDLPRDKVKKINCLFIIVINKLLNVLHVAYDRLSIIHRDLWDYNVLISGANPKIIDYGRMITMEEWEKSKGLCVDISFLIKSWFDSDYNQCFIVWNALNWNIAKYREIRKNYMKSDWENISKAALQIFMRSLREKRGLINYIDIACIVILEKDCTHDVKKTNLEILQDIEDEVKIAKGKV